MEWHQGPAFNARDSSGVGPLALLPNIARAIVTSSHIIGMWARRLVRVIGITAAHRRRGDARLYSLALHPDPRRHLPVVDCLLPGTICGSHLETHKTVSLVTRLLSGSITITNTVYTRRSQTIHTSTIINIMQRKMFRKYLAGYFVLAFYIFLLLKTSY